MSETMSLPIYSGKRGIGTFRFMTLAEILSLHSGERVYVLSDRGDAREVKINGSPQTWKRDTNRFRVPWKYGMYEYGACENDLRFFLMPLV